MEDGRWDVSEGKSGKCAGESVECLWIVGGCCVVFVTFASRSGSASPCGMYESFEDCLVNGLLDFGVMWREVRWLWFWASGLGEHGWEFGVDLIVICQGGGAIEDSECPFEVSID